MREVLARRPPPAMAVALVALFISLGGGAYAALGLPPKSVGAAQLKNGAVIGAKLHKNAVTSADVKDHSLLAKDFRAGQLHAGPRGPKGDTGATGPKGTKGDTGATGIEGPPGVIASGYAAYRYDSDSHSIPISLPGDATMGQVMNLDSGGRHTGPVTVGAPARLFVTATLSLSNQDSSASSRSFFCQVELQPSGGAPNSIGFLTDDSIAKFDVKTWSYTTGLDVSAGTYNVAILCSTGMPNSGGRVLYGDLTVVAFHS